MEGFKQFLKIAGIILACLLGVLIILCVLTVVIPTFYVFGYKFVTGSVEVESKFISYSNETEYSLNIHTNDYNVDILADSELEGLLSYSYNGSYFGFANMGSSRLIVTEGNNELNFSMREPNGLLIKSSSKIIIYVNPNVEYNISFVSESGDLFVSGLNLNKINLNNESGGAVFVAPEIEDGEGEAVESNPELENSETEETPLKIESFDCLNISTSDGLYDFSSYDLVNIGGTSNISIGNGELKFKDLTSSLNIRGKACSLTANNIISPEGFNMVVSEGSLTANSVNAGENEMVVISDDLNIRVTNIVAQVGITATSGNVYIKEITGEAIIKTTSGNISVEKANNNIFVTATSGNITVEKYYKIGQFVTTTGNITVNSLSEYNSEYYSTLATKTGTIHFENNINKSDISVTEKGVAKVKVWNVMQSGDVLHEVYVPNGEASIGIMAYATDIFRLRLVGQVTGSINNLILYANDDYIYHPGDANSSDFSNQTTFKCTGGVLNFSKLDKQ